MSERDDDTKAHGGESLQDLPVTDAVVDGASEQRGREPSPRPRVPRLSSGEPVDGETRALTYVRATWELELLISAAVVFSLFQLPGLINGMWARVEPTLSQRTLFLPFLLYYLATLSVYALSIAFTAHFVLRSFWVGVGGLAAAFPKGIDWDRYDGSDWSKRNNRENVLSLGQLETMVDRVASAIFAALFAILLILVMIFFYTVVAMLAVSLLAQFVFPGINMLLAFYAILSSFVVPAFVLSFVESRMKKDESFGDRWPRLVRYVGRMQKRSVSSTFGRLYAPILMTFSTNSSTKVTTRVSGLTVLVLVAIFAVSVLLSTGRFGYDAYHFLPVRSGERAMQAEHYDDQLPAEVVTEAPMIQSAVIEGPFVELFVPFRTTRDLRALTRHCPELEPLRTEGFYISWPGSGQNARQSEILECLAGVYEVRVDGSELSDDSDWVFYGHPTRHVRGVLRMIDVRTLRPGRHVLSVRRVAYKSDGERVVYEQRDDETVEEFLRRRDRRKFEIPFWV